MTKNQINGLRALIKPMIKEEVSRMMIEVLPALLAESVMEIESQKMSLQEIAQRTNPKTRARRPAAVPVAPIREQIKFSDNPMLQEILENTAGGVPQENVPNPYMMGDIPTTVSAPTDMYSDENLENYGPVDDYVPTGMPNMPGVNEASVMMPDVNAEGAPQMSAEQLASTTEGATVMAALTRDYSGLMKQVESKKNVGPSNIDFSQLPPSDAV